MQQNPYHRIKNLLFPCLYFSIITGVLSTFFVTLFKLVTETVIDVSLGLYNTVRENPAWLPLLILGAATLGLCASLLLSVAPNCRGGGIPTSVAAICGIVRFQWIKSIFFLPFSALLTFLGGLPLGTEGPCVQMGTAVGDGVIQCLGTKKYQGWRRYSMTGGACAGFSIATASPLTAIIFSIEELHKHFSPLLLTVVSISVISAQITSHLLSLLGLGTASLFEISIPSAMEPSMLFVPVLVGLLCGAGAILFTRFYHLIDRWMHRILKKASLKVLLPVLFACTAVIGYFFANALGSGHSLSEQLFASHSVWYLLLLTFLLRMVLMVISNTTGATGGIFLPTIAFGALMGSLAADCMIAIGWVEPEQYVLIVVLGIASFLGATSRIPITACVFSVEALGGIHNIVPIVIATSAAFFAAELSGLEDITDTIVKSKVKAISKGNKPSVIQVSLTVNRDSFVVGKEMRDILWPNSCVILSFAHNPTHHRERGIAVGDVITVHYETYHPSETAQEFKVLVGKQSAQVERIMNP